VASAALLSLLELPASAVISESGLMQLDIPQPWLLSMDRITWELGSLCFNLLMLDICHQGVAF